MFYVPNPSCSLEGDCVQHVHHVHCAPFHMSSMNQLVLQVVSCLGF
uniref:Uncharacterized protein n=1 Tax=Musa acuminata subsp. malaccensis TaxID=214687 RepID=A0A804JI34_MUSAM